MRIGSVECEEMIARVPFLSGIIAEAFPAVDGPPTEDDVEAAEVDPDEAMYPGSLFWEPSDANPLPFERPGSRRRVIVCLSDETRVVRVLCLQEDGDAIAWEARTEKMEVGRSKVTVRHRLPAHVFVRSNYDQPSKPETILWGRNLFLAVVTVWIGPSARSAEIRYASRPENGFQSCQRA